MGCRVGDLDPRERYGPLHPDPDGILDLPRSFRYKVIGRAGEVMTDGFNLPGAADGMATFPGERGHTIVVRNHEVNPEAEPDMGPFGPDNAKLDRLDGSLLYDAGTRGTPCLGGTTTFVYDTAAQRVVSQYLSLAGTLRNCAGGPTPWNSWITCEEITTRAGDGFAQDHGYPFEVPATARIGVTRPVPLTAMGRFFHEAVAIDPSSGYVYQTEDTNDGLIYRYLPDQPGNLAAGGRLQALRIVDRMQLDTRNWDETVIGAGTRFAVDYVDLEQVHSPNDDLRYQGFEKGAARFARGEGMWFGNGAIYFACTNGGAARVGQIWRLDPVKGTLELFVEPNDPGLIENADNLTVAPWGDLIVCEDGSDDQFLVGITPDGEIYKFARNAVSNSEMAGGTFSPDGTTLFVNIQHDGLTLAITGPWA